MDHRIPLCACRALRLGVAALLIIAAAACTPNVRIGVTNAPAIPDCTPGSAARPCP